jgi:hypothetical protein
MAAGRRNLHFPSLGHQTPALGSEEKGSAGKSLDAGGEEAPAAWERMASTEEKGLGEGEGVVKAGCKGHVGYVAMEEV